MAEDKVVQTDLPAGETAPAKTETTAPDPADFSAWEKAELEAQKFLAEKSGEPVTPAVTPAEKPEEITSEPAGDKGEKPKEPVKAEAQSEPEAGKPKEQKQEKEPEKEHGPGWFRREIKRKLIPLQGEVAELREQLAARSKPEPATVQPAVEPVEPKREDFETSADPEAEYARALYGFDAEQIADRKVAAFKKEVARRLEVNAQEAQRLQREQAEAIQDQKWSEEVDEAKKRYGDFARVVFDSSITESFEGQHKFMDKYVRVDSEHGGDLAYFLASNPDEIERITRLPQIQQVREFTKIEAQFSVEQKPAPKQSTQVTAPPKPKPLTPIGGNGAASIPKIDDPAVVGDYPEWERMEKERLNRR